MDHLTARKLVKYFEHTLPAAEAAQIKEHLACCVECTGRARRVQEASSVLDGWTASVRVAAREKRVASRSRRTGRPQP